MDHDELIAELRLLRDHVDGVLDDTQRSSQFELERVETTLTRLIGE